MGEMDISATTASNLTSSVTDFSVDLQSTDGASEQKETIWTNENWTQYFGYYKSIPEVATVIDAKAAWTVGMGVKTDIDTLQVLNSIKGNGSDSFYTVIENMVRTYQIGGDSYAHIIRDEDGELINLKPLDPGSMRHIANKKGIIIRFEQITKTGVNANPKPYEPEKIFYLPRNRVADEIHGNTMIERLAKIILARNEAMEDLQEVFHRFVKPRWIIKLDTDNKTKIAQEKAKWDAANEKGENMYIPMGSVEVEQMAISPNSTLNPQTWIDNLNTYFYEAANCPKIIVGGSGGFTDAAVKIAYLSYEQNIRAEQTFIQDQIGLQLGIELEFEFPASLEAGLLASQRQDKSSGAAQPNDTQAQISQRQNGNI